MCRFFICFTFILLGRMEWQLTVHWMSFVLENLLVIADRLDIFSFKIFNFWSFKKSIFHSFNY